MGPWWLLAAGNGASVGAFAHPDDPLPDRRDDRTVRAAWVADGDGHRVALPAWAEGTGTRVAAIVDLADPADRGPALGLEVRGIARDGGARGGWLPLAETFRADGVRVAVVDLGRAWDGAELRVTDADDARIDAVGWELVMPRYPDAGRLAREAARGVAFAAPLPSELDLIGVIDRAAWGARPTGCSSTEDDWYRMAIHHTAGTQTTGGTVQGAVQGLQAYSQDSGEYCDIPYQFLVGYDGTLWEGRPLAYTSGATGGGNNDGNIAVCFLGCYHPYGCPYGAGDDVTEEMIDGARLLVQTLVELHDIPSDADAIRGHRDWPGNYTACPGDGVYARLDELRTDLAWYGAAEVARSIADGETLRLEPGQSAEVWIDLQNTGGLPWEPGVTKLGTTSPRDGASGLADASWLDAGRAATVAAEVAPGEVGRFAFTVTGGTAGTSVTQSFGLVHEWVTWFADAPWGGGPGDDLLTVTVETVDPGAGTATSAPPTSGNPGDADDTGVDELPPVTSLSASQPRVLPPPDACGCASAPGWGATAAGWTWIAAVVARRRRRR